MSGMRGRGVVVVILAFGNGCAFGPFAGPLPAADAVAAPFPECEAEAYLYVGRSSPSALGLDDDLGMLPHDAQRPAMIWVTVDRGMCMEFDDGSGMGCDPGCVQPDWLPPAPLDMDNSGSRGWWLPVVGLAVALVVVLAASLVAFRSQGRG
jgi:hypothetical protein